MKRSNTSERLKEIMKKRGLRQIDILKKCEPYCEKYNVKLKKNDLSQYVSGKVKPNQDKLSILGMALGVSEIWLMGYDEEITKDNIVKIPIYGSIAAGIPISANTDVTGYVYDTEGLFDPDIHFCLEIKGDSMTPDIQDGDIVVVRIQPDANSGEIVAVMVNSDEAVCKRLRKYEDSIALISNNPLYEPMIFTAKQIEELPVRIVGKVVEMRRKY